MFPERARVPAMKAGRYQKGVGLPAAMFVIVILAMIVVAVAELGESASEGVVFQVQSERAFLAAESGAQLGLNRLLPPGGAAQDCSHTFFNSSPSISLTSAGLSGCTATVTCRVDSFDGSDLYTLESVGTCGSGIDLAERAVTVGIR